MKINISTTYIHLASSSAQIQIICKQGTRMRMYYTSLMHLVLALVFLYMLSLQLNIFLQFLSPICVHKYMVSTVKFPGKKLQTSISFLLKMQGKDSAR